MAHTPVFLTGKSYGKCILAGHSSWDCKRVGHSLANTEKQKKKTIFTNRSPFHMLTLEDCIHS